jgi:ribonuclease BN (tRNA processing enzyme)
MDFCKGADLLFHDAEYTPQEYSTKRGWGHSLYTEVLDMAMEAGVKNLGLFHINSERTDSDMDSIVESCKNHIQNKSSSLNCFAAGCDVSFSL